MAHKGRYWKLWFRRDAAWFLNVYTYAYPEAYYVTGRDPVVSLRWRVSESLDLNGLNLSKDYDRRWTSAPFGGVFDNAYWSIELLGPPDGLIDGARLRIKHSALIDTPLVDITYDASQSVFGFENFFLHTWRTVHFISPDVTFPENRFRLTVGAATYARYNP